MTISLPSRATLRPLELPARADEGPTPVVREYAEVRNAVTREETGSDDDAMTAEALLPMLYSDANMVRRQWYIERDGAIIGCAPCNIQQDDGASTAIGTIAILKHWSEGIGTAVLAFVEERAHAAGVQVERASEFVWSDESAARLAQLRSDAEAHAADYRTVHWMLPTPDDFVDGYAWMKSRMSTDVPDAELGTPVEVWDADRVRELEKRYAARGARVQVTAAQHIAYEYAWRKDLA